MIRDMLQVIRDKGIKHSNYCSDLFIYVTEETTRLVNDYQYKCNVTTFISETDGKLMYEIPFAYWDYYTKKGKR